MSEALTGGCHCGAVRYELVPGWRMPIYTCHCTDCQRRSGASFQLALPVLEQDLAVTGDLIEARYTQPSGVTATAFACAACHTRIYVVNSGRPGMAAIRAGTLDNAKTLSPLFHLWIKSKQPWITLPHDAITLETQPASSEEWLALAQRATGV